MRSLCKLVLEIWNHVPFALRLTTILGMGLDTGDWGPGSRCGSGAWQSMIVSLKRRTSDWGGTGNEHLKARLSKYNDIKPGLSFKGSLCQYHWVCLGMRNRDCRSFDGAAIQDDPGIQQSSKRSSSRRSSSSVSRPLSDIIATVGLRIAGLQTPDSRIIKCRDPNALQSNTHETSVWHVCALLITIISV